MSRVFETRRGIVAAMVASVFAFLLAAPVLAFAESGPGQYSYLQLTGPDLKNTYGAYLYYHDGSVETTSVKGATYDKATNTLTLRDFSGPITQVRAVNMGNDFTIKVLGTNKLFKISCSTFASDWGCGLAITGTGSLTVDNSKGENSNPIAIEGNGAPAKCSVASTVGLELKSDGAGRALIQLTGTSVSSSSRAISLAGDHGEVKVSHEQSGSLHNWILSGKSFKQTAKGASGSSSQAKGDSKAAKVKKGSKATVAGQGYLVTKAASASAKGAVTFTKAKNSKNATVPATVKLADGKAYVVTKVAAGALKGSKIRTAIIGKNVKVLAKGACKGSGATRLVLKTGKLTKSGTKGCLAGSKVSAIQVKVGSKPVNAKIAEKYRKFLTKKHTGTSAKKLTVG